MVIIMVLRTKRALITGGSRGIGYEIARRLTEAGADVVITGRTEKPLRAAAEMLGVQWLVWDAADISVMQENFDRCVSMMGGFDTLVSNAGILTPQHEWGIGMLDLTEAEWDAVMNVNLKGAFFMMQTAVRYLYINKIRGNVLNIASVAATEPGYGPYVTSKCGLVNLTRGWGRFFAPHGIVINGIGPGPVATEMNNWHKGDPLEHTRIPTGRFLTVEEVGAMAMYLLSEEANQVIGQTFFIDGAYDIK
jgi:NAD(P)-dependent dehydrogenase (short-subunit alcohol dehydrogenase family)